MNDEYSVMVSFGSNTNPQSGDKDGADPDPVDDEGLIAHISAPFNDTLQPPVEEK